MENKKWKEIVSISYSIWMDIRRSLTKPLLWPLSLSGICIVSGIIAIGITDYYEALYEDLELRRETRDVNYAVQMDYLHSPEAKLVEQMYDDNWSERVYSSIRNSSLVLSNSSGTTETITVTLIGSSKSFFAWYNELQEVIPCTIYIESIIVTGQSISFQCNIVPITKGI